MNKFLKNKIELMILELNTLKTLGNMIENGFESEECQKRFEELLKKYEPILNTKVPNLKRIVKDDWRLDGYDFENLQFDINRLNIYLDWSVPDYGFGQLHIHSDTMKVPSKEEEIDVVICENEIMSRDFVRGVLMSLVDKIMSEGLFDDSHEYKEYHKQRCDKLKK